MTRHTASSGKSTQRAPTGQGPPDQQRAHRPERARAPWPRAAHSPAQTGALGQGREAEERQQREARILDAAAALLVRWGYRKTTIDDVAREAGVGKGTIYLHWKDKNTLFRAAILRASQLTSDDAMRRIAADPEGGLPHRQWMHTMLAALGNPLMVAIMKGQTDIFQGLITALDQQTRGQLIGGAEEYIVQLQRAGLIRVDLPVSVVTFLMTALKMGVISAPDFIDQEHMPTLEQIAEALSDLIRRWLEPERLPSDTEAGKRVLADWFERAQDLGSSS